MQAARKLDQYDYFNESYYQDIKKEEKVLDVPEKKDKTKHGIVFFKMAFCLVVIVSALTFTLLRHVQISELKYNNFKLKSEMKELQMEKDEMVSALNSSIVIDHVEQVAMEQLNMGYPLQSQIVYLDRVTYVSLEEEQLFPEEEVEVSYLAKLLDSIKLVSAKLMQKNANVEGVD